MRHWFYYESTSLHIEAMHGLQSESVSLNYEASGSSQRVHGFREGAINTLRGGCANLASLDPKMLSPPKNGNIGLDPP